MSDGKAMLDLMRYDRESLLRALRRAYPRKPCCPHPPKGGSRTMSETLTLDNAPLGTKATAIGGGHWVKVAGGWRWLNGDTFPTVGGDWNGVLIPPTDQSPATPGERGALTPAEDAAMKALLDSHHCGAEEGKYCGGCVRLCWNLVHASRAASSQGREREESMRRITFEPDGDDGYRVVSAPPAQPSEEAQRGKRYKLRGDNNEGWLIGIVDDDGDVHLSVCLPDEMPRSVEFCTARGGGRDPEFTKAARAFVSAIALAAAPRRES